MKKFDAMIVGVATRYYMNKAICTGNATNFFETGILAVNIKDPILFCYARQKSRCHNDRFLIGTCGVKNLRRLDRIGSETDVTVAGNGVTASWGNSSLCRSSSSRYIAITSLSLYARGMNLRSCEQEK